MPETRPWPVPVRPTDGILVHHVSDTHFGYRPWSYAESDGLLDDLLDNLVPVPDLSVHTGDVTESGADPEDRYALWWLKRWARGAPNMVAMGNHDVRNRKVYTRMEWEQRYRRRANSYVDVGGWRFVTFAVDVYTGDTTPWVIPSATWDWLDEVVGRATGPVVLVNHYPPSELGVDPVNYLQPASVLSQFVGDHPSVAGMLCGHMHVELTDTRAANFWNIGGRQIPVLCNVSSMLSLGGRNRDQAGQVQSHSAYVSIRQDRWEVRYRAHGTHVWTGPQDKRLTVLDLPNSTVERSYG